MSDALITAITDLVDEPGAVVIGYCLVAAYKTVEMEDRCGYTAQHMSGQPFHSSLGLVEYLRMRLHKEGTADD